MPSATRPVRYSPAALILLEVGVTQDDIGSVLGYSGSNVGHQLRGHSPVQPGLIDAIRMKAGEHTAERIARIIGAESVAS